jgi:glycosyltransferase involved in cell wall biosynthesis
MKVLVVCEGLYPPTVEMSGISMVYKLQHCLCQEGVEVHILTAIEKFTDPSWRSWYQKHKPPTTHLLDMGLIVRFPKLQFLLTKGLLFLAALRLQAKHHFDIIHEYSSTPLMVRRTAWYRRLSGVKTVHTLCVGRDGFLGSPVLMGKNPSTDLVICTSAQMKDELLSLGVTREKVAYLPLGVDFEHFQGEVDVISLRVELSIPPESPVVLHLGLLEPRKGAFTLASAIPMVLREHPEATFLTAASVTEGTFYDYQRSRWELLRVTEPYRDNFRLITGKQDVRRLMSLADVFVLPLNTIHGTIMPPVSLLEAMAAGKAVVAADLPGVHEVVKEGENGLLFPAKQSAELAKAINLLLSEPELRRQLGEKARESVKQYDVRLAAKQLKRLYWNIAGKVRE